MAYDAILRNLEILSEAARRMPDDVTARIPEVAWREIGGMRKRGKNSRVPGWVR